MFKINVPSKASSPPLLRPQIEWTDWIRDYAKPIFSSVGVLLLAGIVSFAVLSSNRRAEDRAHALQSEASRLFHEPPPLPEPKEEGKPAPKILTKPERLKKAAELFDEVTKTYPRTKSAMIAQYESGNVYYALDALKTAKERYQAFLAKYPEQKTLSAMVRIKMAYLYQKEKNPSEAMARFRALYNAKDGYGKDQAGYEVGRLLETEGKGPEAIAIYKEITKDSKDSPWGMEAQGRLSILEPPPPPPAPTGSMVMPQGIGPMPSPMGATPQGIPEGLLKVLPQGSTQGALGDKGTK